MKLIRFVSGSSTFLGTPVDARTARVVEGDLLGAHRVTDRIVPVHRLLAPIVPTDILCIGLNYRAHAAEVRLGRARAPDALHQVVEHAQPSRRADPNPETVVDD